MADNYTDSFEGDPYFIKKGEQLSAAGVNAALNTKENVANKKDTVSNSSTEYPSCKAVSDSLDTKENVANKKDIVSNSSTEYPSCKAVSDSLAGVKLPVGTILMYDGSGWIDNQTIVGWYACIAANVSWGCPNLVDSFIKGSATVSKIAGGNRNNAVTISSNNLPAHSHTMSGTFTTGNQSADHTHSIAHDHASFTSGGISGYNYARITNFDVTSKGEGRAVQDGYKSSGWNYTGDYDLDCDITIDFAHTHSIDVPSYTGNSGGISADHTHDVTLSGSTGDNTTTAATLNIEPQSYALIFIR
ncbi:MAG: hypothetical protein LBD62_04215, partial [Candidatus Margulisbacteria bacterium]|nr:hypothetical protein [Candidatus Margulisiibacteriota bacterium]